MNAVITFECRMQLRGSTPKEFIKLVETAARQTYLQWEPVPIKDVSTGKIMWKFVSNQKGRLLPCKSSAPALRKIAKLFKKSESYGVRIIKAGRTGKSDVVSVTIQVYGVIHA